MAIQNIIKKFSTVFFEFLEALKSGYTYHPFENPYVIFGFLWGLPIPLQAFLLTGPESFIHFSQMHFRHPYLFFFDLHPFIFAIFFGALGCIRQKKEDEIQSLIHNLEVQAKTDELTKLFNRRYFLGTLYKEDTRASREKRPFSIIMTDIDDFKKINDHYGHPAGDEVLKILSELFIKCCRPYDTVARWGGEEFIILLPGSDWKKACEIAERIRKSVEEKIVKTEHHMISFTLSLGVCEKQADNSLQQLIDHADLALYAAKHKGKNRVEVYQETPANISAFSSESTRN
jgi:diguanylate cyclase (GGDEF)-like protein